VQGGQHGALGLPQPAPVALGTDTFVNFLTIPAYDYID